MPGAPAGIDGDVPRASPHFGHRTRQIDHCALRRLASGIPIVQELSENIEKMDGARICTAHRRRLASRDSFPLC